MEPAWLAAGAAAPVPPQLLSSSAATPTKAEASLEPRAPGLLLLGNGFGGEPVLHFVEALPQGLVEVARAELDAQRSGAAVGVVEVLVHGHFRRHVHGVAGDPVVALAVHLGVAAALEHVQHGLGVGVGMAARLGRLFEDVGDGHGFGLEVVGLVAQALAAAHQDVDGAVAMALVADAVAVALMPMAVVVPMMLVAVAIAVRGGGGHSRFGSLALLLAAGIFVDPVLGMEGDAARAAGVVL